MRSPASSWLGDLKTVVRHLFSGDEKQLFAFRPIKRYNMGVAR